MRSAGDVTARPSDDNSKPSSCQNMSNATLPHSKHPDPQWEPKFPFDLVIAYEDTTTRNRALTLYDHLAQELIDDCDFQCSWWKFEHFLSPSFRDHASDLAAQANMVVLSLRSATRLPDSVQGWVESWLSKKGRQKSALVTLVAGAPVDPREVCPIQAYLEKVAHAANMDFFSHIFDQPSDQTAHFRAKLESQANFVTPLMEEILEEKFVVPKWGINE
jgi:hypothetical protein